MWVKLNPVGLKKNLEMSKVYKEADGNIQTGGRRTRDDQKSSHESLAEVS